jgi:hypothetical protein
MFSAATRGPECYVFMCREIRRHGREVDSASQILHADMCVYIYIYSDAVNVFFFQIELRGLVVISPMSWQQ